MMPPPKSRRRVSSAELMMLLPHRNLVIRTGFTRRTAWQEEGDEHRGQADGRTDKQGDVVAVDGGGRGAGEVAVAGSGGGDGDEHGEADGAAELACRVEQAGGEPGIAGVDTGRGG